MKRKILYGNPYTGYTSSNRKSVENSLKTAPGMISPFKISHSVHKNDRIYRWMIGKRGRTYLK